MHKGFLAAFPAAGRGWLSRELDGQYIKIELAAAARGRLPGALDGLPLGRRSEKSSWLLFAWQA
jgi:hypothetical protein